MSAPLGVSGPNSFAVTAETVGAMGLSRSNNCARASAPSVTDAQHAAGRGAELRAGDETTFAKMLRHESGERVVLGDDADVGHAGSSRVG